VVSWHLAWISIGHGACAPWPSFILIIWYKMQNKK
jgi:hypothetical protein